jgi:hypothetical protein
MPTKGEIQWTAREKTTQSFSERDISNKNAEMRERERERERVPLKAMKGRKKGGKKAI